MIAHVADAVAQHAGLDRLDVDDRALEGEAAGLGPAALAFSHDPHVHRRARRSTQAIDRLLERHVERGLGADAHDAIAAVQARAIGRRARDRADHGELVIADRDDDAEAAELAARAHAHVLVRLRVEEHRVRIERAEHAVDGCFLDLAEIDLLVVEVLLDEREDVAEALGQGPRAVHVVDAERPAGGVDLQRELRGAVFVVDQHGRDLTLDRVETAEQHTTRLDALGLDVVLDDLHQHAVHQHALGEIVRLVRAHLLSAGRVVDVDVEAVALWIEIREGEGARDRERTHTHLQQASRALARGEPRVVGRAGSGMSLALAHLVLARSRGPVRVVHRSPRAPTIGRGTVCRRLGGRAV